MAVHAPPTLPQEALAALCASLASTNSRPDAERHFTRLYRLVERPFHRFIKHNSRGDDAEAPAEVFQDVMSKLTQRIESRHRYAKAIKERLALVVPPGDDRFFAARLTRWMSELEMAAEEAMRLPFLHDAQSPVELEAAARRSNQRLGSAVDEGVRCLTRALEAVGLSLQDRAVEGAASKADAKVADVVELENGDVEAGLDDEDESAGKALAAGLDRKMRAVMAVEPPRRRAKFRESATGLLDADPMLVDFARDMGELVFMAARLRMPLLGYLYSMARNLAVDRIRREQKTQSLEDLLTTRDGEGVDRASDAKEMEYLGFHPDPSDLLDDLRMPPVAEELIGRMWGGEKPRLARKPKEFGKLSSSANHARRLGNVLVLRIEDYSQETIAQHLGISRDQVRTALGNIEEALEKLNPGKKT